jgi:hypothetical protein
VTTLLRCLATATAISLLAGCSLRPSGAAVAPDVTLLGDVNDLLRAASGASGHMPTKLADVERHKNMFPRGYEAVKSGNVVVLWGTPAQGEGDIGKASEAVVAYEKQVPTEGGYVLLSAGSVKKMTAEEFAAAPKAGKR